MDLQEEREFNETMSLVKAVLERLGFHAFEDVLIWSNEYASRALLRCLKKTLSEFENGHLVLTSSYPKLEHFSVDSVARGLMTALDQAQERQDSLNREIDELSDQLAKAQAVPEWISVEDSLPKKNTKVLLNVVARRRGKPLVCVGFYSIEPDDDPCFVLDDNFTVLKGVTHWMMLPQPPEAQEQTNESK